jgi:hypothetical protein
MKISFTAPLFVFLSSAAREFPRSMKMKMFERKKIHK